MIYQQYIPKPPLSHFVQSISYIEGNNKGTGLPKIAMSMVFNLQDHFKLFTNETFSDYTNYKYHWIAGLQTQPSHVQSYGTSKMLVVQFNTLGAFVFLNDPLHYYTNQYVPLDCIFNSEVNNIWEQLNETPSRNAQFQIIETFLNRILLTNKSTHLLLSPVVKMLFQPNGEPISEICKKLKISRKHLNHLVKEQIGVSPKTISSLMRFQQTLKTISNAPEDKLTEMAYQLNYFDQAHFIKDFKKFSNLTPTEYAKMVKIKSSIKTVPHFIPFD